MADALERQLEQPTTHDALGFEERLALLVDAESLARENRRIERALRTARFRYRAHVHDIDYNHPRGLSKAQWAPLIAGHWLHKHLNLLITGQTGTGKSFLACAIGDNACRLGFSVRYFRTSRLFKALEIARGDGSYAKLLSQFARTDLIILDDFALEPFTARQRTDLLELLEDRYGERSVPHHQPAPRQALAQGHRRPNTRRCHSRPHRAQRTPTRTQGGNHARESPTGGERMSRQPIDIQLLEAIDTDLINASNRLAWLAPAFEPGTEEYERCFRLASDVSKLARRIERRFAPYRNESIRMNATDTAPFTTTTDHKEKEENLTDADRSA